jgi:hypothetical protein
MSRRGFNQAGADILGSSLGKGQEQHQYEGYYRVVDAQGKAPLFLAEHIFERQSDKMYHYNLLSDRSSL